jgi:hypothetical protein
MAGSLLKNLRMFIGVCGQKAMPNVVLATTMWGEVRMETGERREKELKESFWKDMLEDGCRVERFKDTYESAWCIIDGLGQNNSMPIQLQLEMGDRGLRLDDTQAGIILNKDRKASRKLGRVLASLVSKFRGLFIRRL